ncbi:MAG: FHA domain-containing protein [Planctomycetaceae bacterium]
MIDTQQGLEAVTLTIQDASGGSREYRLRDESGVFIGKSTNCGLQIASPELSDIHCRIGLERGRVWVQDWMSAQGTYLNGQLIDAQMDVNVGDVIQIGRTQISVLAEHRQAINSSVANAEATAFESASRNSRLDADDVDDNELSPPIEPTGACELPAYDDVAAAPDDQTDAFDFAFNFEEETTYDRETVALLRAEIEELQTALAQRDAASAFDRPDEPGHGRGDDIMSDPSDEILRRMQELIDEANRSDERVSILEELLHAAEDTHQAEQEERNQLEAWVTDIEQRIGQRDAEYAAEIEALRQRLDESHSAQNRLQRQLQEAAFSGSVPKQYEQSLQSLQHSNLQLQEQYAQSQKQCLALEKRLEELSSEQERSLREERIQVAQEQAKLARMRFELSKKLVEVDELPRASSAADVETSHRIRALREHLLEIHEQEKQAEKESSLTTRLAKLWKRTERNQNG